MILHGARDRRETGSRSCQRHRRGVGPGGLHDDQGTHRRPPQPVPPRIGSWCSSARIPRSSCHGPSPGSRRSALILLRRPGPCEVLREVVSVRRTLRRSGRSGKEFESAQRRWRGRAVKAAHLVSPLLSSTFRATWCASSSSPATCPGGAAYWPVRVIVESRGWCSVGHFGLMVVTVFRWVAHLSGERWATPVVRVCVVHGGVPSYCPGVQAVIRFAYSGAVRRGPRWEFSGGPLS